MYMYVLAEAIVSSFQRLAGMDFKTKGLALTLKGAL